jgi:hypothetical protein
VHALLSAPHFCGVNKMKAVVAGALFFSAVTSAQVTELEFKNVTHLDNAVIAFGAATTNGNDMYIPASDGSSVGVIESHDAGATTTYMVDPLAPILMAAGASSETVMVGGLLGLGLSNDFGTSFTQIMPNVAKAVTTQDIKFETASGLFGLTGNINGVGAVAVSADQGVTWSTSDIETTPPLINSQDVRYASFPTADTWYATAGFWGDDTSSNSEVGGRRLSRGLKIGADGKMSTVQPTSTYSGAWATVVKTTDGGSTWTTVFNDTSLAL